MDSPWDEVSNDSPFRDVELSRISTEFTNAGYREGITAGKEAALQEGFDMGLSTVGVPIGRQLGLFRGISSAVLVFLKDSIDIPGKDDLIIEAEDISSQLSRVQFSDIMPRDLEAEQHAREHREAEGVEEGAASREREGIEDTLANLSSWNGENQGGLAELSIIDINVLKSRLDALSDRLRLGINYG